VLDEFYRNITAVAVSAVTGEGMDELFDKIDQAAEEYHRCGSWGRVEGWGLGVGGSGLGVDVKGWGWGVGGREFRGGTAPVVRVSGLEFRV